MPRATAKDRPVGVLLRRGFGRLLRCGPIAAVKGALLVAPRGALGLIDRAIVIGVDAVEALAEAAVAVGRGQAGEPVVVGLDPIEPGLLLRREISRGELEREFVLAPLDEIEPPIAVLLEGNGSELRY